PYPTLFRSLDGRMSRCWSSTRSACGAICFQSTSRRIEATQAPLRAAPPPPRWKAMISRRLLTSIALFLSGCAGTQQGYPSLAKRAVEGAPMAEVAPPTAPAAADPALKAQIDKLSAQAQAGKAAFDQAYVAADRATQAARGSAVSSEGWVAAQVAISTLESTRNDSVSALASLDTLYVARSNAIAEGQ